MSPPSGELIEKLFLLRLKGGSCTLVVLRRTYKLKRVNFSINWARSPSPPSLVQGSDPREASVPPFLSVASLRPCNYDADEMPEG